MYNSANIKAFQWIILKRSFPPAGILSEKVTPFFLLQVFHKCYIVSSVGNPAKIDLIGVGPRKTKKPESSDYDLFIHHNDDIPILLRHVVQNMRRRPVT